MLNQNTVNTNKHAENTIQHIEDTWTKLLFWRSRFQICFEKIWMQNWLCWHKRLHSKVSSQKYQESDMERNTHIFFYTMKSITKFNQQSDIRGTNEFFVVIQILKLYFVLTKILIIMGLQQNFTHNMTTVTACAKFVLISGIKYFWQKYKFCIDFVIQAKNK